MCRVIWFYFNWTSRRQNTSKVLVLKTGYIFTSITPTIFQLCTTGESNWNWLTDSSHSIYRDITLLTPEIKWYTLTQKNSSICMPIQFPANLTWLSQLWSILHHCSSILTLHSCTLLLSVWLSTNRIMHFWRSRSKGFTADTHHNVLTHICINANSSGLQLFWS